MKGLIITYLLTYGGGLAALFNPFIGLLVYVCFAIIRPEALWHWAVPPGNYSRIVAIGLLAGWALHGFGNWRLGRAWPVVVSLLCLWIWSAICAAQASNQEVAWSYVEAQSKIFLPFLVGISTIDSVKKIKQLVWVIVLSQGYVALDFNLSYLNGLNVVRDIGFGGLLGGSIAITMLTCFGMAFFLGLNAPAWWQKAAAFGSAACMMHVILFSFSRGGMLGLIITAVVIFLLIPKKPKHYFAFAVGIALTLRLAGPAVVARFTTSFTNDSEREASAQSRLELWGNCMDLILRNPLFGVGPNHFAIRSAEYGWPEGKEGHSTWLQTAAEIGLPGLFFLLTFYAYCGLRLWPYKRESTSVPDPWFRSFARMVIASLTGFAISAQFVTLVALETPYYVTMVGAAALKLLSLKKVDQLESKSRLGLSQLRKHKASLSPSTTHPGVS